MCKTIQMKIVLAFDAFKGCLSAVEACAAAATGIRHSLPDATVIACPLSDGGEGFADALAGGTGHGEQVTVTGPLDTPVEATLAWLPDGTAVVEAAQACGLTLVPPADRSPLHTTTTGVGELIRTAIARGARRILVGLGGSATNDAGMGMLAALDWQFLDAAGHPVPLTGAGLGQVAQILPGQPITGIEIIAACDVTNPLDGPQGAAAVYAPQKGASTDDVATLDQGLAHYAAVWRATFGKDWAQHAGAGAAGGLGFALLAGLGASMRAGAEIVIEAVQLREQLVGAALCLTGEGRTDAQTIHGKLPAAVASCCREAGIPCVCLSGALGAGWRDLYAQGMTAVWSISHGPQTLEAAINECATALADAAEGVARLVNACTTKHG